MLGKYYAKQFMGCFLFAETLLIVFLAFIMLELNFLDFCLFLVVYLNFNAVLFTGLIRNFFFDK